MARLVEFAVERQHLTGLPMDKQGGSVAAKAIKNRETSTAIKISMNSFYGFPYGRGQRLSSF